MCVPCVCHVCVCVVLCVHMRVQKCVSVRGWLPCMFGRFSVVLRSLNNSFWDNFKAVNDACPTKMFTSTTGLLHQVSGALSGLMYSSMACILLAMGEFQLVFKFLLFTLCVVNVCIH